MCLAHAVRCGPGFRQRALPKWIHQAGELGRQPFASAGTGIAKLIFTVHPAAINRSARSTALAGPFSRSVCIAVLRCDHGEEFVGVHPSRTPAPAQDRLKSGRIAPPLLSAPRYRRFDRTARGGVHVGSLHPPFGAAVPRPLGTGEELTQGDCPSTTGCGQEPNAMRSAQSSCRVGRNRISLMSTSSGWLIAKRPLMLAKDSAGRAIS